MPAEDSPNLHYQISLDDLQAHLFGITLTIQNPQALQRLSLPAWIPGSYLIREFAKNLQSLRAQQNQHDVSWQQINKSTWEVSCNPQLPLIVSYQIYAFDNSVRTAWLDAQRGFFNPTSLCLSVQGQTQQPHTIALVKSAQTRHWQAATALQALRVDNTGFGTYYAENYDQLVDSPFELGTFWSGEFVACGIPHRFIVTGASAAFDGAQLLADSQKICETAIRFWHPETPNARLQPSQPPPHPHYLFMLNAVHDGYGGLEHRNSTALICRRGDLPQTQARHRSDGYIMLLGLISHEYFHTWNVKRLRPAEFLNYDYSQENYTELLWFFEGFTSYYDDLLLHRAALIDTPQYLKLLGRTINTVEQTPGAAVQTVAQASFDAWTKYYRQDENTINATISYYTKGSLVALCLDLSLRNEGNTSLDAVMRELWHICQGGAMTENDLLCVLERLAKRSFATEIKTWVHSTHNLPVQALLQQHGIQIMETRADIAQQLGLRVNEKNGILIQAVLRASAAESAGFATHDEWLGIEVTDPTSQACNSTKRWRITQLSDIALYAGTHHQIQAIIARERQLLQLPLQIPADKTVKQLHLQSSEQAHAWLNGNIA